jgi:hypothetical protein
MHELTSQTGKDFRVEFFPIRHSAVSVTLTDAPLNQWMEERKAVKIVR